MDALRSKYGTLRTCIFSHNSQVSAGEWEPKGMHARVPARSSARGAGWTFRLYATLQPRIPRWRLQAGRGEGTGINARKMSRVYLNSARQFTGSLIPELDNTTWLRRWLTFLFCRFTGTHGPSCLALLTTRGSSGCIEEKRKDQAITRPYISLASP